MNMQLGIDRFISDKNLRAPLAGKRVALLAHPASVTKNLTHSVDAIHELSDIKLVSAFGPQHGMRGEKQDNMIESPDFLDPIYKIPVFSLYGKVRRPTPEMINTFDAILIDLQDVGCRIYTFITTLLYILEEGAARKKSVWILDRPNPAGRPVEGSILKSGWESFVGAGPIIMRHGLTMGELAKWFVHHFKLDVDLKIIEMKDYKPESGPGFGWPTGELAWVNPSPNASSLSMARCYAGTVMIEGTQLSEARGTTKPLEMIGAPDIDMSKVLKTMMEFAPNWLLGCKPRICHFEPTFNKHAGKLCHGIQFHVEDPVYSHNEFRPYRAVSLMLKSIRLNYPDYPIWRDFAYEYEKDRLAIDLICGGSELREWVDDKTSKKQDLESLLAPDEAKWIEIRRPFLIY